MIDEETKRRLDGLDREVSSLRGDCRRAIDAAHGAQRAADAAVRQSEEHMHAVTTHNGAIEQRLSKIDADTGKQTSILTRLEAAENRRELAKVQADAVDADKARVEAERIKVHAARDRRFDRFVKVWPLLMAALAVVGSYFAAHWKP